MARGKQSRARQQQDRRRERDAIRARQSEERRGGGGGGAGGAEDQQDQGINWKAVVVLIMIVLPAIFLVLGAVFPNASTGGMDSISLQYRQDVMAFYEQYNPEKLADIDSIMAKYRGKEHVLLRKLKRKYGVRDEE